MPIQWQETTADEIRAECPYCGTQTLPPTDQYCLHVAFVYVDPPVDNPGFDFIEPAFARKYLAALKKAIHRGEVEDSLPLESEAGFLSGDLPPMHSQDVLLHPSLLTEDLFSVTDPIVHVFSEADRYYPTTVTVAFQPVHPEVAGSSPAPAT